MAGDIRMESVDLDQPHREDGGIGPSSPSSSQRQHRSSAAAGHMRHRGQSSTTSSTSSSSQRRSPGGMHFTNIKRINVINNFGFDASTRDRRSNINGWNLLRIVLIAIMVGWLGVLVLVVKRSPPSSSTNTHANSAAAEVALQQWKELTANSTSGLRMAAVMDKVKHHANFTTDENDATNLAEFQDKFHIPKEPRASIFELSLFGNKSPYDFQRYTPHAPSCSEPLSPESVSFTLVSQLSNDRLWMVPYHCQRWGNNYPMSIAVLTDRTVEHVKSELVAGGCSEELLTVQTVKRTKYDPKGTEYPVNLMRNLAFSKVKTSHIVYADIDFWPATDLHSILSNDTVKERLASDTKLATVIPVFQMNRRCRQYWDCRDNNIPKMPKNKDEMIELIMIRKGSSFDPTNKGGHGSTMYKKWLTQETGTFVDLPCIQSNRYEPYLTVRYCSELPPFQEGFTGYGKNKMTWAMQLRRAGYLFSQLGGAFLVHYPHLDSNSRLEWNKTPKEMKERRAPASDVVKSTAEDVNWQSFKRARIDALFLDFKEWLVDNVEDDARVPKCDNAANDDKHLWVHKGDKAATASNAVENSDGGDDDEEKDQDEDDETSTTDKNEEEEDGEEEENGEEEEDGEEEEEDGEEGDEVEASDVMEQDTEENITVEEE